jgi:hypothetical protein
MMKRRPVILDNARCVKPSYHAEPNCLRVQIVACCASRKVRGLRSGLAAGWSLALSRVCDPAVWESLQYKCDVGHRRPDSFPSVKIRRRPALVESQNPSIYDGAFDLS